MANWPRIIDPDIISPLWLPTGLSSRGHSGIAQLRTFTQSGWVWREIYNLVSARDPDGQALMAWINRVWNRMEVFQAKHLLTPGSGLSPNGVGGGTPVINGAAQTGVSVVTDGWTLNTTNVIRGGDVVLFAGDTTVYRQTVDLSSNGSGQATLNVVPALRKSPADGAALTLSNIDFQLTMTNQPTFPSSRAPTAFGNIICEFAEYLV